LPNDQEINNAEDSEMCLQSIDCRWTASEHRIARERFADGHCSDADIPVTSPNAGNPDLCRPSSIANSKQRANAAPRIRFLYAQ
jgi:hypothetical protein